MQSISEQLSRNIHEMAYDDLPDEVREEAKLRILDIIAATVPAWILRSPLGPLGSMPTDSEVSVRLL